MFQSDYGTIKNELATLRRTYSTKSDAWIKEKLDFQQRLNDLGDSLRSSAGEGWESERERQDLLLKKTELVYSSSQALFVDPNSGSQADEDFMQVLPKNSSRDKFFAF